MISRQTADWNRLFPVGPGLGPAAVVIVFTAVVVGLVGVDAIAGSEGGPGAGPGGVFPFGFGRQAVALAGLLAEPLRIGRGVVPGDMNYRPLAPPPTRIVRLGAICGRSKAVVLTAYGLVPCHHRAGEPI